MKQEDKAGLYITIIAHLVVIIVFLCIKLSSAISDTNRMVIDFSAVEEKERAEAQQKLAQEVSKSLDELIAQRKQQAQTGSRDVRNVAVDASDAETKKLYEDAERLQSDLAHGKSLEELEKENVAIDSKKPGKEAEKSNYKGPSVVSYNLGGRKASHLSIPAYKCFGGGDVTVIVVVNNQGKVVDARILREISSDDRCLQEFALKAARASYFSVDTKAPARQEGDITYRFIPQ